MTLPTPQTVTKKLERVNVVERKGRIINNSDL